MRTNVKTLLFGFRQECEDIGRMLSLAKGFPHGKYEYRHINDMGGFEQLLATWLPTLVIVLADGAAGMESVYRSRQRYPNIPVFWFSNDRGFGMQAHRLDCAYFSTKPVTPEKLTCALRRCEHVGIAYTTS